MAPDPISRRELTAALFARQLLHRDHGLTTPVAVRRLVALQAQYSPSPHVALHARIPDFHQTHLEAALVAGDAVKSTLMRGTLHVVAGEDYGHFAAAWRQQALTGYRNRYRDSVDEDALAASLREFTGEPRSAQDLKDHVDRVTGGRVRAEDLLNYARALVPLVHVAPSGHWRAHGKPTMTLWQGELPPEPDGTALLVRRYLEAFGPASRADIAQFTWLRMRQINPALAALEPLVRHTGPDGTELFDLPDRPMGTPEATLPVRYLPKWEAALLSHADRTRILPAELYREVYRAVNGECLATYLVDGVVAGTWRHSRERDTATLCLHALRPTRAKTALTEEGKRLLAFLEPDATRQVVAFD
jgi:hypothetical protein